MTDSVSTLADIILIVHVLFTGTVVFCVPLIIAGGLCRWAWVRTPWFRLTHLAMIGFVAFEALIGMDCPLTVWESHLRLRAGHGGYSENGFISDWLGHVLFYSFPHWVFTLLYISYGLLVLGLFYVVPLRWKRKRVIEPCQSGQI